VVLSTVVLLPSLLVETIGLVVTAVSPECPAAPAAKMVVVPMVDVMVLLPEVMVVSMVEVVMADAEAEAEASAVRGVSLVCSPAWDWGECE
jgi:hypothetical protein